MLTLKLLTLLNLRNSFIIDGLQNNNTKTMRSAGDRKTDPFYKPPPSVQKTSAEIINEARNSLRTLRTQRPFTPREDQRKLFGPLSSRTPDNRPPSAFSLHANHFDSADSRPVSGTRLSPLLHKPKLPLCPAKDDDIVSTIPQPPETLVNETETEWELDYWNENVLPILQDLEAAEQDRKLEDLCSLCVKLQKTLEHGNMLGKQCKRRSTILKTLYKLVDIGCDRLGLNLAKLILALKVSGKNLLNICKLIFKISRSENNDRLFQNDNTMGVLLEVLQNEDAQVNSEAFLYCLGTIKFLSGNTILLSELLRMQGVEILVELMKQVIHFSSGPEIVSSNMSHLVVQLTATLRNLADLSQSRPKFLACGALLDLCILLDIYIKDKDICTNISRIYSKLSTYNDCCSALANCSKCYPIFLAVLNKHQKKQDLVVRIVFTLSNLTAKTNKAREEFFQVKGSINALLSLLHHYCSLDVKSPVSRSVQTENPKSQKRPSEVEDVLIKLISLLANLSIHSTVGTCLASDDNCVLYLMKILEYKAIDECEELVINTLATLSNLSFYENDNSAITKKRLDLSKLLFKFLLCNNMEGMLEAVRVFGNLSHYQDVRDFIVKSGVYKFIVTLLDSRDQNVCYFACGVVTNLATDSLSKILLKEEDTMKRLVECLRDFGPSDWQLATVVCKALWNIMEDNKPEQFFDTNSRYTLLDLLSSLLGE
ncbi:armadillo repeat-containing protein 2 [Gastrophryne carolinensis]